MIEKIVLDLETKKGLEEVRDGDYSALGISVAGIFSYKENAFRVFLEKDIQKIKPYLEQAELVIGFNIRHFDFSVLQPYLDLDLEKLNILDILEEVKKSLGFRLGLNSLAEATLAMGKTGSGLDALKYFRQGQLDKLSQYCQNDVLITRQLYEYGQKHNHLVYRRGQSLETIPIGWGEAKGINEIIEEGFDQRKTLEIEYSSPGNNAGQRHTRQIDIYAFDLGRIIAYCHLRKDLRTFNIRRILSAELSDKSYVIPAGFNLQEFKAKQ